MAASVSRLHRVAGQAARAHGGSRLRAAARARRLRSQAGWEYDEQLRAGLLDPLVPASEAERHASPRQATEVTRSLNPATGRAVTEERIILHRLVEALGLPAPELYGALGRDGGWSAVTGRVVCGREAAVEFLRVEVPDEVALKPSCARTPGVRALRREGDELVDAEGRRQGIGALVAELWQDPREGLFVVQERLASHPELARASSSPALQTLHVTTFVADDGSVLALHGGLARSARSGAGAVAEVDLGTGRVGAPRRPRPDGCGFAPVSRDEWDVEGRAVPGWRAAVDLARECAAAFLPHRTVAWQIAPTDRGPLLLDAEPGYGPWPGPVFGDALRAMRRALATGETAGARQGSPALR